MNNLNPLYIILEGKNEIIKHTPENAAKLYDKYVKDGTPKKLAGEFADAVWKGKPTKDILKRIHTERKVKELGSKLSKGLKKLPKGVAKIIK